MGKQCNSGQRDNKQLFKKNKKGGKGSKPQNTGNIMSGMDHQMTLDTEFQDKHKENDQYIAAFKFLTEDDDDSVLDVNKYFRK